MYQCMMQPNSIPLEFELKDEVVNVVDVMDCLAPLPTLLASMHIFIAFHVLVAGCVRMCVVGCLLSVWYS